MSRKSSESGQELTKEQLQAVINEKLSNTLYWLSKAYRVRPRDPHTEKTLLSVMAGLQKIQKDVNKAFTGRAESPH
jgi:hypothetical protein